MANTIQLAIIDYNGTYEVSGDLTASGNYHLAAGAILTHFSGEVTGLGAFSASLESGTMKYKLEPAAADAASDLMAAVLDIEALIMSGFSVEAPVISGETLFGASTEVSISGPARSDVYYTDDGSTPTSGSTKYSDAITLNATTTIKAIAIKDGVSSEVASKTFTKLAAPTISGETPFESSTEVAISGPEGSSIYYTTDGTTPTSGSSAYTEPITLSETTTIKAIAIKDGVSSEVTTKEFTKS